jgi:hypothetical protein
LLKIFASISSKFNRKKSKPKADWVIVLLCYWVIKLSWLNKNFLPKI